MINTKDLIDAYERNLSIIKRQVEGLSHQDCLLQPPFKGNCMNWVLGHIAGDRNAVLGLLGQAPLLSKNEVARYGYGSEPVCEDGEGVLTMERLLDVLERSQAGIAASLAKMGPEDLAKDAKSHLGTTTLGQLLFFRYWHETYHVGQAELLRQLAGTDDKVI